MNRRQFIGASATALAGVSLVSDPVLDMDYSSVNNEGPYSIEIVSPPEDASRELPLFDTYKQAENFAHARMNILRQNEQFLCDTTDYINTMRDHEAGLIKVWSSDGQVVYECAWGETWTSAHSYVNIEGNVTRALV